MCEEMVAGLVKSVTGDYKIQYSPKPGQPEVEIDFTPPFKRISMIEGLEERMGIKLPAMDDPEIEQKLVAILKEREIECTPPHTTARLLDELVGEYLEANIIHPTFITDHPQIMSPLAKHHRSKPGLTERFELFSAGREVRILGNCVFSLCITPDDCIEDSCLTIIFFSYLYSLLMLTLS
jgi:lysyl-tRNA synthetase class 2